MNKIWKKGIFALLMTTLVVSMFPQYSNAAYEQYRYNYNLVSWDCPRPKPGSTEWKELLAPYGGSLDELVYQKLKDYGAVKNANGSVGIMKDGRFRYLNDDRLLNSCIVSFGDPSGVPGNKTRDAEINGISYTRNLYVGFTVEGQPYPNPEYPEWFAQRDVLTNTDYEFFYQPWDANYWRNERGYSLGVPWGQKEIDAGMPDSGFFKINQGNGSERFNDKKRSYYLGSAFDKYSYPYGSSDGRNYFRDFESEYLKEYRSWFANRDPRWVSPNVAEDSYDLNGDGKITPNSAEDQPHAAIMLTDFAYVHTYPTDYSAGNFTMYLRKKGASGWSYGYSTFYIPPIKNLFSPDEKEPENLVCKNVKVNGNLVEGNKVSITYDIEGKNIPNGTKYNNVFTGFRFEKPGDTEDQYWYELRTDIPGNGVHSITANGGIQKNAWEDNGYKDFVLPRPNDVDGKVRLILNVNADGTNPSTEATLDDNRCIVEVPVGRDLNAKVEWQPDAPSNVINGKTYYFFQSDSEVNIPMKITNEMGKTISAPCAPETNDMAACDGKFVLQIRDETTGQTILNTGDHAKWNDQTMEPVLNNDYRIMNYVNKLKPGKYSLTVKIPNYKNRFWSERTTADNWSTIYVEVGDKPLPPSNIMCDSVIKQTTVGGQNVNLAKLCFGSYPNYPSTKVEGGIGSYFWAKYFFYPMPIPQYSSVSNAGEYNQILTLNEKYNQKGGKTNFLYYPNTSGNDPANLGGPYYKTVYGDTSYNYRGRMVTDRVDFNYEVLDPKSNKVASGKIVYDIPIDMNNPNNSCLRTDMIDYKNGSVNGKNCRDVSFYLPSKDFKSSQTVPKEADKLQYLNPGKYQFILDAQESQSYYYQKDNGEFYYTHDELVLIPPTPEQKKDPNYVPQYQRKYYDHNTSSRDKYDSGPYYNYNWQSVKKYNAPFSS